MTGPAGDTYEDKEGGHGEVRSVGGLSPPSDIDVSGNEVNGVGKDVNEVSGDDNDDDAAGDEEGEDGVGRLLTGSSKKRNSTADEETLLELQGKGYDHSQCSDCSCVYAMTTDCILHLAAKGQEVRVYDVCICKCVCDNH